jgi:hypothetical protein
MMHEEQTDYRARLHEELVYRSGGTMSADRINALINGLSAQAVREDRARRVEDGSKVDRRAVLADALVGRGWARYRAVMFVDEFCDVIARNARADSDHEAYRVLADKASEVLHQEADPDDWDGDDSEVHLLCTFVEWLPDMVRHGMAEKIRAHRGALNGLEWHEFASGLVDPFERTSAGQWVRKSDGAPVPWPVVKE